MFEAMMRGTYDAMERKDLDGVMKDFAEDAVFEYPGHTIVSGRHEGKAAIRAFFARLFDVMGSLHFTISHAAMSNPVGFTFSNVVYVAWVNEPATRGGRRGRVEGITAAHFHGGKVAYVRDYIFDVHGLDEFWKAAIADAEAAALPA